MLELQCPACHRNLHARKAPVLFSRSVQDLAPRRRHLRKEAANRDRTPLINHPPSTSHSYTGSPCEKCMHRMPERGGGGFGRGAGDMRSSYSDDDNDSCYCGEDHQEHDCPLLPPGEQWFAHRPAGGQVTDSKIKRAPDKVIKGLWDSWRAYRWKKKPDPIIDQKTGYKKTGTKKGWSKRK